MVMNTQQLFYLTEIERTRSISQAADNLFMSQPNLSRVLKETEDSLGFAIFQRTRRGVQPTEKGSAFLRHAKNILREAEFMEGLGPGPGPANRFRVCLPRSRHYGDVVGRYLNTLSPEGSLDAMIRECHPRQALEHLSSGDAEIAILRYSTQYQAYFSEQAQARQLRLLNLNQVEYQLLLSREDPLARQTDLPARQALKNRTELVHRDIFWPGPKGHREIYVVERQCQLELLQTIPGSYCWAEPLPEGFLDQWGLTQRACLSGGPIYQNALVYKPHSAMSDVESRFLCWITETKP